VKLSFELRVPMSCPACDGEDFYILQSHPFGDGSKCMRVRCESCEHVFYTNEGGVPKRFRKLVEKVRCDHSS
jgi:transcriptional regulator NrdR family protein